MIATTNRSVSDIILREGREYVSAKIYKYRYKYNEQDLTHLRVEGLPHIIEMDGLRALYYYNTEDCERWHRGED